MLIQQIVLRHIRLPLCHPFRTSFGEERWKEAIIVAAQSEGLTGYGEVPASPAPLYSYETIDTAWHILQDFVIPLVIGRDVHDVTELVRLLSPVRGHPMAKAGLEAAIWDLVALRAGKSLSTMLGGVYDRIPCGVSIGIQRDLPSLLDRIDAFLDQGYKRINSIQPGWELDMVAQVRGRFGDVPLMLDANAAFSLEDVPLFQALDEYDLMMIEQPLDHDDLFEHHLLQRQLQTPICLDESIRHHHDARATSGR